MKNNKENIRREGVDGTKNRKSPAPNKTYHMNCKANFLTKFYIKLRILRHENEFYHIKKRRRSMNPYHRKDLVKLGLKSLTLISCNLILRVLQNRLRSRENEDTILFSLSLNFGCPSGNSRVKPLWT